MPYKTLCITGGCGFIGRAVVRQALARGDCVYLVDSLTYAADPTFPAWCAQYATDRVTFVGRDVRALQRLPDVDAVIHLAATTHVDNSLTEGEDFVAVNVGGTAHLLELVRGKAQHGMPHFVYVSTDEVYGDIADGQCTASDPLRPSSPYAASKAAADLLVQAWGRTYEMPYTILRPTNVFGIGQHPEKLIPKCVRSCVLGRPIPIHGDGSQTRQWLHVEDCADAIILALDHGGPQNIYNINGTAEVAVKDVAETIARLAGGRVEFGFRRPGMDMRYSVDDSAIRALGWCPKRDFWKELPGIVREEMGSFRF